MRESIFSLAKILKKNHNHNSMGNLITTVKFYVHRRAAKEPFEKNKFYLLDINTTTYSNDRYQCWRNVCLISSVELPERNSFLVK